VFFPEAPQTKLGPSTHFLQHDMAGFAPITWSPTLASWVIGGLTLLLTVYYVSGLKAHPKEPKVIRPWIPVVGHLVGMALHGGRYVKRLG
jgi:hypothetical protein